ncbi:hypothetical protein J6590_052515 [Homalodisca vitripennis]|nr:hypothetical protein J6590_052515 [Homalodisca vitripennis]
MYINTQLLYYRQIRRRCTAQRRAIHRLSVSSTPYPFTPRIYKKPFRKESLKGKQSCDTLLEAPLDSGPVNGGIIGGEMTMARCCWHFVSDAVVWHRLSGALTGTQGLPPIIAVSPRECTLQRPLHSFIAPHR